MRAIVTISVFIFQSLEAFVSWSRSLCDIEPEPLITRKDVEQMEANIHYTNQILSAQ